MEQLVFGKGRIGIETNTSQLRPTVVLSVLNKPQKIGSTTSGKKCRDAVGLVFNNLEGLSILVDALHRCQGKLTHKGNIPLELRFGA